MAQLFHPVKSRSLLWEKTVPREKNVKAEGDSLMDAPAHRNIDQSRSVVWHTQLYYDCAADGSTAAFRESLVAALKLNHAHVSRFPNHPQFTGNENGKIASPKTPELCWSLWSWSRIRRTPALTCERLV